MKNLQALREKISNLAKQANHLIAEKGSATWTAEEQATFDAFANDINAAKAAISNIEKMREMEADKFFNAAHVPGKTVEVDAGEMTALAATALYMRFGNNVTPEQAVQIRNAMSTTTTTEGGFTVQSDIAKMVIDKMKAYGGMREMATVITTDSGNPLNFPTSDGTAEVGEIVGENAPATALDVTFGTIALPVYKYSTKKIALPVELIQDSGIDVIAFVVARLATRLARIQNTHFTVGTGTGQPMGCVTASAVGKTGLTGQTLTVTYDDLIDLKHSVNRAYRANAAFCMNDLSVAVVSKLKETTGRPIWEYSTQVGAPDTLLGKQVSINDDVPVMAAGAKSILFGDCSSYNIRDVANSISMRRFDDSAFALLGQVGFCGWQRSGGNLLDTAACRTYVNSAT